MPFLVVSREDPRDRLVEGCVLLLRACDVDGGKLWPPGGLSERQEDAAEGKAVHGADEKRGPVLDPQVASGGAVHRLRGSSA
jgi:hypothetical protein